MSHSTSHRLSYDDSTVRATRIPVRPSKLQTRPHLEDHSQKRKVPESPSPTVTSGGLAVNGRGEGVDADDTPIAGLYAAGSTVGGIEGGPSSGYVGGLIKSFCIGLIAADTIVGTIG